MLGNGDLLSCGLFLELFSKRLAICNLCTLKILPWNSDANYNTNYNTYVLKFHDFTNKGGYSRNFLLSFDSQGVTGIGAGK